MVWKFLQLLMVIFVTGAAFIVSQQYLSKQESACFKIVEGNQNQPYAPVLLNECSGTTWMLVRMPVNEKEQSFTYQWQILSKYDFVNPTLVQKP